MKQKTIVQIWESYLNGNISWVKKRVKKMNKIDFVDFLELARSYGIKPYQLRHLLN